MPKQYDEYVSHMRKLADVEYSIEVLNWDKEVNLPEKGAKFRSQQIATLTGIAHDLFTEEKFGELLETLNEKKVEFSLEQQKNIALSLKEYKRTKKYSTAFVIRKSETISATYHSWVKARAANDYDLYKNDLAKMVAICRDESELLGYEAHPYNALLEIYEPGCTVAQLDSLFTDVKKQLVDFVKTLNAQTPVDDRFLHKFYAKDKQWDYGLHILKHIGYDFGAGRQDISHHPFSVSFSPEDVRVTTRVDENNFGNMTWSTIHEGGHALYEQGLKSENYGLPLGQYISMGIHESQSRLWENNVGRGLPFWENQYGRLQKTFPENLGDVSLEAFYKGINKVVPSYTRTEADEITYHFHVLIRYEIEKMLMVKEIETDNLREVWNSKYKEYLGINVPDDNQGILQDIHWSHGSFGYFPTYSLGSFYAAQFYHQVGEEIPGLEAQLAAGDCTQLLSWLRKKVHRHGQFYTAEELCRQITGSPLNFKYFMDYACKKYGEIYGFGVV